MTFKEFSNKWLDVNRSLLSIEDELEFVEDAFNMYEEAGFLDTFNTPHEDLAKYNDKPFKVVKRLSCEEDNVDLENLPMWGIVFDDDDYVEAFPEDICKLEH